MQDFRRRLVVPKSIEPMVYSILRTAIHSIRYDRDKFWLADCLPASSNIMYFIMTSSQLFKHITVAEICYRLQFYFSTTLELDSIAQEGY